MSNPSPEEQLASLYVGWLKMTGLPHSEANLERFLRWLDSPNGQLHPAGLKSTSQVTSEATSQGNSRQSEARRFGWGWFFAIISIAVVIWLIWSSYAPEPDLGRNASSMQDTSTSTSTSTDTGTAPPPAPAFDEPELSMPPHGYGTVGEGGLGCLEISVPSGPQSYYVKLKNGSYTVWDVFMSPGQTASFDVPVGTYDLVYGAGEKWYGWDYTFGPYGAYSETSEQFSFDSGSCWSVELILQVGGNLGTSGLDFNEF